MVCEGKVVTKNYIGIREITTIKECAEYEPVYALDLKISSIVFIFSLFFNFGLIIQEKFIADLLQNLVKILDTVVIQPQVQKIDYYTLRWY